MSNYKWTYWFLSILVLQGIGRIYRYHHSIYYDLLSMVTFYNEKNDVIVSEYVEHVKGHLSTLHQFAYKDLVRYLTMTM
jgi:hypothetical protein